MKEPDELNNKSGQQPVLASKLKAPCLRQVLERSRLLERIDLAHDLKLVSLCAGPGFGKTTMMVQIAQSFPGHNVWYQIDPMDNDPAFFLRNFVAGVTHACSLKPERTRARLDGTTDFINDGESVLAVFMDELKEQSLTPVVVCFDDLHLLNNTGATLKLIDHLVQHISQILNLVIASRTAPNLTFSRLRSQGVMFDMGEKDLKFSLEELSALMYTWDIDVPDATLRQVHKSTEGWAAGLVLTETYLRSGDTAPDLFTHRKMKQNVYEYLAEEVLRKQPEEAQGLLMRAALIDPVVPSICAEALSNETVGHALAEAVDRNLFTSRVRDTDVFRYHPLFREFLLSRLETEIGKEAIKHTRALFAEAFMNSGNRKEAIEQFLEAGYRTPAAKLIELEGKSLLHSGEHNTLRDWLNRLGKDHGSPTLNILDARLLIENGKSREAVCHLAKTAKNLA